MNYFKLKRLVYASVCLALAMVLPLLTGHIPQIGKALSPMHLPVLLCGFLCGGPWGAAVGFAAPFLRYAIFSMPAMPNGIVMAFELGTYGLVAGVLSRRLPSKLSGIYLALLASMLCGRAVWGVGRFLLAGLTGSEFPWQAFVAGAFVNALPGIVLQLVLIPLILFGLKKAGVVEIRAEYNGY